MHAASSTTTPLDLLALELGAVAGRIEREVNLRILAATAELARRQAELDAKAVEFASRFEAIERAMAERLATLQNGKDGLNGKDGKDGLDGKDGQDGKDGRAGTDGKDGEPGGPGDRGERGEPGLNGLAGLPGKLPMVRAWTDQVHGQGEVVAHDGATWQAQRDTGHGPPHEHWICLARAGADGAAGSTFRIRGTWEAETEYRALDVAVLNGGAFCARRDDPGPCPGEGWQLMASQGKQGKPGERGPKGERGPPGPAVVSMAVDAEGLMILTNSDGSIVQCDLYPLLSSLP
jgi:hypothetical protein